MTESQIQTDWGRFAVEDTGGNEPPIVFLHGGASNLRAWDNVISRIESDFRCISFDLPGHGLTRIEPLALPQLQDALLEACDRLAVRRPLFIGHSFGGLVSAYLATSPGVAGVVAVDPYLSDQEVRRNFDSLEAALDEVRTISWPWPDTLRVEEAVEQALERAYKPRPDQGALRAMIRRGYRPQPDGSFRRFPRREDEMKGVEANWSVNVLQTFKDVQCPLSIALATSIPAERLASRRRLVQEIRNDVRDSECREFDCEHDIPGYRPSDLADYIVDWAGRC